MICYLLTIFYSITQVIKDYLATLFVSSQFTIIASTVIKTAFNVHKTMVTETKKF